MSELPKLYFERRLAEVREGRAAERLQSVYERRAACQHGLSRFVMDRVVNARARSAYTAGEDLELVNERIALQELIAQYDSSDTAVATEIVGSETVAGLAEDDYQLPEGDLFLGPDGRWR